MIKQSLNEWIQCLCSNVIDRLVVATSQSAFYGNEQTLNLDTNQASDPRPNCALCAPSCASRRGDLKRKFCLFCSSNCHSNFVLMKHVFPNESEYTIPDDLQQQQYQQKLSKILSCESSKIDKCSVPLLINESTYSNCTP